MSDKESGFQNPIFKIMQKTYDQETGFQNPIFEMMRNMSNNSTLNINPMLEDKMINERINDQETGFQNPIFEKMRIMNNNSTLNINPMLEEMMINERINDQNKFLFEPPNDYQINFDSQSKMNIIPQVSMNIDFEDNMHFMNCNHYRNIIFNYNNFKSFLSNEISDKEIITYFEDIFFKIYSRIQHSITQFNKKTLDYIWINFYDSKIQINIDLRFYICKLIEHIYNEIFGKISEEIIWERSNENQTTQYIIQNPNIIYLKKIKNSENYLTYLCLEYNGINLLELKDKKCIDIGLTNGQEILLKFDKEKLKEEEHNFLRYKEKNPMDEINIAFFKYMENKNTKINVHFSISGLKNINVVINSNELIFTLIEEFSKAIEFEGDFSLLKNKIKFSYNGKLINDFNQKIDNLIKLTNSITIIVYDMDEILNNKYFLLNKNNDNNLSEIIKLNPQKGLKEKNWRVVNKGLNIFGICNNFSCKAKEKEVIFKIKLKEEGLDFNLKKELKNIICPECLCIISPKTIGFWKCEYQLVGKKYENGKIKEYKSNVFVTKDNEFDYHNPSSKIGISKWNELHIYVIERQKISYKANPII